jgi:hypothetical protein
MTNMAPGEFPEEQGDTREERWYDEIAVATGIIKATLKKDIKQEYWVDHLDLSSNPDKPQLTSYAACSLAELRATSLPGEQFIAAFAEDFEGWSEKDFAVLSRAVKRELLAALSRKGFKADLVERNTQAHQLYRLAQQDSIKPRSPSNHTTTLQAAMESSHTMSPTPAPQQIPTQHYQPPVQYPGTFVPEGSLPLRTRTQNPYIGTQHPYVEPHQWQQPETQAAFAHQPASYDPYREHLQHPPAQRDQTSI